MLDDREVEIFRETRSLPDRVHIWFCVTLDLKKTPRQ